MNVEILDNISSLDARVIITLACATAHHVRWVIYRGTPVTILVIYDASVSVAALFLPLRRKCFGLCKAR